MRRDLKKFTKLSHNFAIRSCSFPCLCCLCQCLRDIRDKILRCLQSDARLTTKQLAARVNLSTTPVFERLKRLERDGFIRGYVAILDAEKLDLGFTVFCSVKLKQMTRGDADHFVSYVRKIPQVTECYNISGEFDYLLKILAPSMKAYNEFIINVLGANDSIGSIQSSFVMDEIKHEVGLCL